MTGLANVEFISHTFHRGNTLFPDFLADFTNMYIYGAGREHKHRHPKYFVTNHHGLKNLVRVLCEEEQLIQILFSAN